MAGLGSPDVLATRKTLCIPSSTLEVDNLEPHCSLGNFVNTSEVNEK
jgi:hypothetical protein